MGPSSVGWESLSDLKTAFCPHYHSRHRTNHPGYRDRQMDLFWRQPVKAMAWQVLAFWSAGCFAREKASRWTFSGCRTSRRHYLSPHRRRLESCPSSLQMWQQLACWLGEQDFDSYLAEVKPSS